jgi:hypothetical protein
MAYPTKACESCKGTGKVVDNAKKMHIDSGKERPSKKDSSGSYSGRLTDNIKGKGKK